MSETFHELYASLLKDVFSQHARQQVKQGIDGLVSARAYAEQGKPDFALAFLLLIDVPDEEKRALLARAYEQRARHSDEKAAQLQTQFHRTFPMITLDAQKDRATAQAIRGGARVPGANTTSDEVEKGDQNEQGGEVEKGDHKGTPLL